MAAATSKGPAQTTPWGNDVKYRNIATAGTGTYYPATMVCLNGDGYAVKASDTAGLRFDGIVADSYRVEMTADDTQTDDPGAKRLKVERPMFFSMYIAATVTRADIGKKVYAKFDNEVALTGVSNSILVGYIDDIIDANNVWIRPIWMGVSGVVGFDGGTLTFSGASAGNTIVMPDNLADALSVKEGANAYLTFVTTNGSEAINVQKNTTVTANLTMSGAVDLIFSGTTGQPEVVLTDNLADALSVKISGGNDLLVFKTTDNAETVQCAAKLDLLDIGTVAAAGTVQGDATALTNMITYVTGSDGTKGVVLPAAAAGLVRIVYDTVAASGLKVYPATGDDINDGAANAAITMEGKTMAIFIALDATTWAAMYTANS